MNNSQCRFCNTPLKHSFVDLGMSPFSNAYIKPEDTPSMEPFFPLHARVCDQCFLVQLEEFQSPSEIFSDYAYFSSYSDAWLKHARNYTEIMIDRFALNNATQVIEIASNDGYLLQYFKERNVPVLGIEPAENVAKVASEKGIPTIAKFFGAQTAKELLAEGKGADLLLGNNVLAHVPDINDFVSGLQILLKESGVITMEFPHLLRLIQGNQFDTIYHEHFSYLSFTTVRKIFSQHGLKMFDVEQLPTHGGSLRVFACHEQDENKSVTNNVDELIDVEMKAGLAEIDTYLQFTGQVKETKRRILEFLIAAKREKKTIVGYGAPAKGNTLLNYCGIRTDFIDYTVDRSPHKQGRLLPGTHIPVYSPDRIKETRPDYIFILPWNIEEEIIGTMAFVREWGGKFVVPIPEPRVIE